MFETTDFTGIPAISENTRTRSEPLRQPSPEFVIECENPLPEFGNESRSASELARHFGVSDRAIQNWHGIIKSAYCWLPETELKTGTGKNTRYTPLAIKAMSKLKAARSKGMTADDWVADVHSANADKLQPSQPEPQPEQPTEVVAGLALIPDDSPFSGLTVTTKATQKRELLQAELEVTEGEVDSDFADFLALSTEIMAEDEAFTDQDELEWQVLRKRNAQKWLKRRAILERDKQQILQGDVPLPKSKS